MSIIFLRSASAFMSLLFGARAYSLAVQNDLGFMFWFSLTVTFIYVWFYHAAMASPISED